MEEIQISTLPSDFFEEEHVEPEEVTASFTQFSKLRQFKMDLVLYNGRTLSITTEKAFQSPQTHDFDISVLDPQPERHLHIAWRCIVAGLIFLACIPLLIPLGFLDPTVVTAVLLGAGFFLTLGIYRSHDRLIFYSMNGRVPLLSLFNKNPGKSALALFTEELGQCIQDARARFFDDADALSHELKTHRQLMEAGVISKERYDEVKQRILSLHKG